MLKFDEAFEIVMGSARRLGSERVGIGCALGRVLAEDVVSDIDIPPFNKSAMVGFACRRSDLGNELAIIETIAAGYKPKKVVGENQCARIMTGAVVPAGADCVIMKEYVEMAAEQSVRFVGGQTAENICRKGEDVKKGEVVLESGCRILPQHIAVLASSGCAEPLVSLRAKVGIIPTGDELVEPGRTPAAGQIRNSNGPQLAAQVTSIGAEAKSYGIAGDTRENLDGMVKKAMGENDVLILSGGVSVGDYDIVREILKSNGFELLFEKIAVKPGKPMVFGVKRLEANSGEVFCFGLPGNPVSTFVMFELFVNPFLYKMCGYDFKPVCLCKIIRLQKSSITALLI